jgi:hypothetical protein
MAVVCTLLGFAGMPGIAAVWKLMDMEKEIVGGDCGLIEVSVAKFHNVSDKESFCDEHITWKYQ